MLLVFRTARKAALRRSLSSAAAVPPPVVLSVRNRVAVIEFNRPRQRNAMTVQTGELFEETVAEVERLQRAGGVGCVVLTGRGSAFSAGGDLGFLLERADTPPAENADEMRRFYGRFLSVRRLQVPVVAAINGHAVGAGLCLALACDVRVAAARAKLGLTFSELGLHPGMGATHFLPQAVGPERAARMLLTGEMLRGEEARAAGLCSQVVPSREGETDEECNARVLAAALEVAEDLAARSPVAIRTIVGTLRNAGGEGLERALRREADAQAVCYASDEYRAAVLAVQARTKAPKK